MPEQFISDIRLNLSGILLCLLLMLLSVKQSDSALLLLILVAVFLYRIKWCAFKKDVIVYGKVFPPRSREIPYGQVESIKIYKRGSTVGYIVLTIDLDEKAPFFFKEINIFPVSKAKARQLAEFFAIHGQSGKLKVTAPLD